MNADGSTTSYVNGPRVDHKLEQINSKTGLEIYFLQDHLGSTIALAGQNGDILERERYDPYGATSGSAFTRYLYTGREFDSLTGLLYLRACYYDPAMGRFLSEDPARSDLNFYSYVHNDPISGADPLGLWDTYTHQALFWNALKPCGVSNDDIWMIQQESDFVDLVAQMPGDAYEHSMRAPWQSPEDALQQRDDWINTNLNDPKAAISLFSLGIRRF